MNIAKPGNFVVGIRSCGLDTCKGGYKGEIKDKNWILT